MIFQLWMDDGAKAFCFSQKRAEFVKPKYHDMKIGESRDVGLDSWIIRIA